MAIVNKNPRVSSTTNNLFLLDSVQTSFTELFGLTKNFISNKDEDSKYKDFYAGSVGVTVQQLLAGHSEYNAYQAITARREAYLYEAQQRSSAIGISATLGYSVYRGKNVQLLLRFKPNTNIKVEAFSVIGSIGETSVIALETRSFKYGEVDEIKVTLGNLMEEELTIPSTKTHSFRFSSSRVSEDIQLVLNDSEVPYSRDILELLNDTFITISNPVGGIDVFYLNRFPPSNWHSSFKYTFSDYISPDYSWRPNFKYSLGDYCRASIDTAYTPIFYECIQEGETDNKEPSWKETFDDVTTSGLTKWKCIGALDSPRYFRSITPGISESGYTEPVWTIQLNSRIVEDTGITWIATDKFGVSRFPYESGHKLKLRYVELEDIAFSEKDIFLTIGDISVVTLRSKYQSEESLDSIRTNAPLYHETKHLIRGREDYRKLCKEIATDIIDVNSFDISPAVVQLSYVKNHTTKIWEADMQVDKGDLILSSTPNNYIYKALSSGRTGSSTLGVSALTEPPWSRVLGSTTVDGQLTWICCEYSKIVEKVTWSPKSTHQLESYCLPTTGSTDIMFQCIEVNTEPNWSKYISNKTQDNEITWNCEDSIFLNGYNASYYTTNTVYSRGDYVQPANSNGFFYKCVTSGKSGNIEPEWGTTICTQTIDNTVVWECYDLIDSPLYTKNVILKQLASYRPFGVEPNTITDPNLINVKFTVDLTLTESKDIQTVKNDLDEILNSYQRILGITLSIAELENIIEQNIEYVLIARITVTANNKSVIWEPGMLVKPGDVVEPTTPNGYLYKCQLITKGSSDYTSWEDRGYSQSAEPVWTSEVGTKIVDGYLTWEVRPRSEFPETPSTWKPDTLYVIGSAVVPTTSTVKVVLKLIEIEFHEPEWPESAGKSVKDNRIFWVCIDPTKTMVPLSWNDYYIFTRSVTTTISR